MNVNLSEAKAHLGQYVEQAASGSHFLICARNRPMAELRPLTRPLDARKPLKMGLLKGKFAVPVDFNDRLDGFEKEFYGDRES